MALYEQRGVIPRRWVLEVWHHPLQQMAAAVTLLVNGCAPRVPGVLPDPGTSDAWPRVAGCVRAAWTRTTSRSRRCTCVPAAGVGRRRGCGAVPRRLAPGGANPGMRGSDEYWNLAGEAYPGPGVEAGDDATQHDRLCPAEDGAFDRAGRPEHQRLGRTFDVVYRGQRAGRAVKACSSRRRPIWSRSSRLSSLRRGGCRLAEHVGQRAPGCRSGRLAVSEPQDHLRPAAGTGVGEQFA
jgi:hypothetical protein